MAVCASPYIKNHDYVKIKIYSMIFLQNVTYLVNCCTLEVIYHIFIQVKLLTAPVSLSF